MNSEYQTPHIAQLQRFSCLNSKWAKDQSRVITLLAICKKKKNHLDHAYIQNW